MNKLKKMTGNKKFVDTSMPHDENMVWWDGADSKDLLEETGLLERWDNEPEVRHHLEYRRISEAIPDS